MASISASPATIPAGGTSTLTVSGLIDPPDLIGNASLVSRATGAPVGVAQITVQIPMETVGLESDAGTTYFVRPPNGFTLTKTSPTTFSLKHNG